MDGRCAAGDKKHLLNSECSLFANIKLMLQCPSHRFMKSYPNILNFCLVCLTMTVFSVSSPSDLHSCPALSSNVCWRVRGWRQGRRWTDRGDGPAPNQYNHSSYQTAIQSVGKTWTGGEKWAKEWGEGDKDKQIFACIQISPPSVTLYFWLGPPAFVNVGLFKSRAPEELAEDGGACSYRSQPKSSTWTPRAPH